MAASPAPSNQQRVILGPLTTTYTAPSSCSVPVQECQTCNTAGQAQSCHASSSGSSTTYGAEDNTDCWPPRSSFVSTPLPPLNGWGFYSPGLVCPNGMTTACSATGGGSSDWPVQFALLQHETAVGCSPSGYSCSMGPFGGQTCAQLATSTNFQALTCQSGTIGGFTHLSVPMTVTAAMTGAATAISQYTLYAPLIQLNRQSTDLPSAIAAPTSTSTSSIPLGTSLLTDPPAPSSGLAARAGIGVGVTLAVVVILVLAFFASWRRRNAHAEQQDTHAQRRDTYTHRGSVYAHGGDAYTHSQAIQASPTATKPTLELSNVGTWPSSTAAEQTLKDVSKSPSIERLSQAHTKCTDDCAFCGNSTSVLLL